MTGKMKRLKVKRSEEEQLRKRVRKEEKNKQRNWGEGDRWEKVRITKKKDAKLIKQ